MSQNVVSWNFTTLESCSSFSMNGEHITQARDKGVPDVQHILVNEMFCHLSAESVEVWMRASRPIPFPIVLTRDHFAASPFFKSFRS